MTLSPDIRRRPDGSIDLDFYRAGATVLRRQAMCDARTPQAAFRLALAKIMMVGIVIGLMSFGSRPQNHRIIELRASKEEPMQSLRERAERIRLQLVNAATNSTVQ